MKNVGLISLGCSKNLVDSENILGLLSKDHFNIVTGVLAKMKIGSNNWGSNNKSA